MLNNLRSSADQGGAPARLRARLKPGATGAVPTVLAATALLGGVLFSTNASAELSDTIHPFVSVAYAHEDNLFRRNDQQLANSENGSDNFRSLIAGVNVERPIGRQIVTANARVSRVSYDNNSQLDYNGKDLGAEWRWFLAAHFDGHIGASYNQVMAPFSDFQSAGERNLRVLRKEYADGTWRFHPSWQLRAGYSEDRSTYDLVSQRLNDRTEDATMVGVDYLASSGSTIGLQFRHLKGTYPSQQTAGLANNAYVQDEQKINIVWTATGTLQVVFLGGFVQRKHDTYTDRDENGTNARLIGSWQPTSRVNVTAQVAREFAAIEGALINSALVNTQSLSGSWDITPKIQATATLRHEKRDFSPFQASTVTLPASLLNDSTRTMSAGAIYRPLRNVSLQASVFRDRRSGSAAVGTNTFKANGASVNVTVQF
jgi:exopolysaccharide biosynthesis operon protein EpsL